MIVPMKKVTLIVQEKDKCETLNKLQEMGLLHIQPIQPPKGRGLDLIKEELFKLEEGIRILERFPSEEEDSFKGDLVEEVITLNKKIEELQEHIRILIREIEFWRPWGNFEPALLKSLLEKNIYIKFYSIPEKGLRNLPKDLIIKKISSSRGMANVLVFSFLKEISLPFKELIPPQKSLEEMEKELSQTQDSLFSFEKELAEKAKFKNSLKRLLRDLEKEKEFQEAIYGMGEVGSLSYLQGYVPKDKADCILEIAKREAWGIILEDPQEGESVPTLLRNPRWIEIIRPLFSSLKIFPGYDELDISVWFLIFLSLFFGILIGDAGYGLIYLGLTFLFKKRLGKKIRDDSIFYLFSLLSISAIVWGLLTGTIFGQTWLSFKPLLPILREDKKVQAICFLIGAIHLSIAHFWKFLLKLFSLRSLAELGWIFILWTGYFLARTLILGENFPQMGKTIFIIGTILIIFFTHPSKNIFKGLGKGFGNLFLNLVNNFTDVVSYLRLFAVGMATLAVADSFNNLALNFGYKGFLPGLISSLILILGHGLNILLGLMSVLVHGVRLNLLEFSNHLGLKWMGFPYRPLTKEEERWKSF